MKRTELKKLASLFGSHASVISDTFDKTAIAERYLARFGSPKNQPKGLFLAFCPSVPLRGLSDDVYRAHCEELVARACAGEDLAPATNAECLAVLMQTATKAPLTGNAGAVADYLFANVLPSVKLDGPVAREGWNGQIAEDVEAMRRKVTPLVARMMKEEI